MFTPETRTAIVAVAGDLAVEPAALAAVVEVESGGRLFAEVEGRPEPLIRFEGHYFDQRLDGNTREEARRKGLASPKAGRVANPTTQAGRWRLLAEAARIDRRAAYESVSWGAGQVMGAHWKWLGYDSIDDLVAEARNGAAGQVRLMARFIDRSRLGAALRRRDWTAFARGYNGPAYAKHGYDRKIADAFGRLQRDFPQTDAPVTTTAALRQGARGGAVEELQRLLTAAGHAVAADGWFGSRTRKAVMAFQASSDLAIDGVAGPLTLAALRQNLPASVDSAASG